MTVNSMAKEREIIIDDNELGEHSGSDIDAVIKEVEEGTWSTSSERMKLYLDVDGVVLDKHMKPSQCLHKFIEYVTEHYDCYWLTTHVTDGETEHLWKHLRLNNVPEETLQLMEKIQGTKWDMIKTEGIDFGGPFLWFEDMPTTGETEALKKNEVEDSLVWVDREKGDGLCKWLKEQRDN